MYGWLFFYGFQIKDFGVSLTLPYSQRLLTNEDFPFTFSYEECIEKMVLVEKSENICCFKGFNNLAIVFEKTTSKNRASSCELLQFLCFYSQFYWISTMKVFKLNVYTNIYAEILFTPDQWGAWETYKDVKTSRIVIPRSAVILHNIYKILFSRKSNK